MLLACLPALAFGAAVPLGSASGKVHVATSGDHSELIKTIPIVRGSDGGVRTIMTIGPGKLPRIASGDRIRGLTEFGVTLNCFEPSSRCVNKNFYRYSPKVEWRIVLATATEVTGGRRAMPITPWRSSKCSGDPPNRNHHCTFVTRSGALDVPDAAALPCDPGSCHVNLVVRAQHRKARDGDILIIGGDGANGQVEGDKGRLQAVVMRPGTQPPDATRRTSRERRSRLPIHTDKPHRELIYTVKLDGLREGEQFLVDSRVKVDVGHLGYSVLMNGNVSLSVKRDREDDLDGIRNYITEGARIGEANGFNCTQGASAFQTPCPINKIGSFRVLKDISRPVFVQVSAGMEFHFGGTFRRGDEAKVMNRGYLQVSRWFADRSL